jgi:hypothetical protein
MNFCVRFFKSQSNSLDDEENVRRKKKSLKLKSNVCKYTFEIIIINILKNSYIFKTS